MRNLMFIAWDGTGGHYMRGLFLPIMHGLSSHGYKVTILHLSSITEKEVRSISEEAGMLNIVYRHITIRRNPLGFLSAILSGVSYIKAYRRKFSDGFLMPRSLMPAWLMRLAGTGACKLIYDADGLALEERVDFAGWDRKSLKFRFFHGVQTWALKNSEVILTRTNKAIAVIKQEHSFIKADRIFKVTNGRTLKNFSPLGPEARNGMRLELGVSSDEILAVYAGTLAPQYCLDEMVQWFLQLSKLKPAKMLFLTGQEVLLRNHPQFDEIREKVIVRSVAADEVGIYLSCADVGLALRRASFSMCGVAPIKIGEYLLVGLPVLASRGIGDTEEELASLAYSILLDESNPIELNASVVGFLEKRSQSGALPLQESVELGRKFYSLEQSIESYLKALSCG